MVFKFEGRYKCVACCVLAMETTGTTNQPYATDLRSICFYFSLLLTNIMSNDDLLLRPYEPRDFKTVTFLWYQAKKKSFPYSAFQQRLTLPDDECYFRDTILEKCEVWVAERGGELLGFMAIEGSYIDQLFVDINHQHQGVGGALMEKAQALSPDYLRLHTFQRNEQARRFYENRGFKAVRFGVSAPPENEPDVEYRWRPVIRLL